jgi:hypothetical protein
VDYGEFGSPETRIAHGRRLQTHHLVAEGGAIRLQRRLFDCGLCRGLNTCTAPQVDPRRAIPERRSWRSLVRSGCEEEGNRSHAVIMF